MWSHRQCIKVPHLAAAGVQSDVKLGHVVTQVWLRVEDQFAVVTGKRLDGVSLSVGGHLTLRSESGQALGAHNGVVVFVLRLWKGTDRHNQATVTQISERHWLSYTRYTRFYLCGRLQTIWAIRLSSPCGRIHFLKKKKFFYERSNSYIYKLYYSWHIQQLYYSTLKPRAFGGAMISARTWALFALLRLQIESALQ